MHPIVQLHYLSVIFRHRDVGQRLLELDDLPELCLGVGDVGPQDDGHLGHVGVVGLQVPLRPQLQEVVPAGQPQLGLVYLDDVVVAVPVQNILVMVLNGPKGKG